MSKDKKSSMDKETEMSKEKQSRKKGKVALKIKQKKETQGKMVIKPIATGNRLVLLALAILFFVLGGLTGAKALTGESKIEEKVQYPYLMSVDGSYNVQLIPNELYLEPTLGEGRLYASALIDTINFDFTALYESEQKAAIKGIYSVEVLIQGYQGGDTKQIVYERIFPLLRDREVTGKDKAKISVQLPINMKEYQEFILRAEGILDAKPARTMEVVFRGTFFAETDYGSVEEPFSYTINVPYGEGLFTLAKSAPVIKQGSIGESFERIEHPYVYLAFPAILLLLAAAVTMAYLVKFTRKPTAEEQLRFDWQSILRKHGSRMIRLQTVPSFLQEKAKGEVSDLISLIKLADELRVPICYSLDEEGLPEARELYLEGGDLIYFWRVTVKQMNA